MRMPGSPSGVVRSSPGACGAPTVVTPPRCSETSASGNAARRASSGALTCGGVTNALPPPWVKGSTALWPMRAMRPRSAGSIGSSAPSLRSTTVERAAASVRRSTTSSPAGSSVAPLTSKGSVSPARPLSAPTRSARRTMRATLSSMTASGTRPSRTAARSPSAHGPPGPGITRSRPAERRLDRGLRGQPVADHDAVEAPLALEDPVQQRAVRGGGLGHAVAGEAVVGGHDGPHARVDDGLERREVDLAERALVDAGEVLGAVGLGLVADEVLDAGGDALLLDGPDEGDREARGEERVLREALEVAAAHRAALQVDHGREDHVDGLASGLAGHQRAEAGLQLDVPRGGGRRRRGELRRGQAVVAGAAHADRAVGHRHGPQADLGDGAEGPGGGAGEQCDLLVEGERGGDGDGVEGRRRGDRLGAGR